MTGPESNPVRRFLQNFEEIICGLFLVTMIALVILNVFLRYLFSYSIFWAEEVATICFVWCVFIGASATYKHKMDIGIDLLVKKTPPAIEKSIRFVVTLILLVLNGYIFYMAIVFTSIAWVKPTAVLGVSSAVVNSALIIGFGLITLHTIRFLYRDTVEHLAGRQTR
ncbi:MAG: TRAP transporter small permease [Arenicella sp.]|nr:TRAP transporter small permease [Arenicella sp.]